MTAQAVAWSIRSVLIPPPLIAKGRSSPGASGSPTDADITEPTKVPSAAKKATPPLPVPIRHAERDAGDVIHAPGRAVLDVRHQVGRGPGAGDRLASHEIGRR